MSRPPSSSLATGMLVMAASSVLFSAMSLLVPLAGGVSTFVIAAARFVTGSAVILGLALFGVFRLNAEHRWLLIVRGVAGAVSVYFFYRGIMKLGLGKGTILNYSYPVFAALFAPLLLKERLTADVLAAVAVAFAGIWLVVAPAHAPSGGIGLPAIVSSVGVEDLLALLGGVLAGVAVVTIRKLRETNTAYIIYLAQCVFGLLVVGWPAVTGSLVFSASLWLILLGIGILATVAQLSMTWAYRHVPATEGSILAFLVPVLNVILGAIAFGERMHPTTVAGSALVLLSCAYVAFRERILRLVG